MYVGFWLAHGVNTGNLIKSLSAILEEKKKVTIVFLNPDSNLNFYLSDYLGIDANEISKRINFTLNELKSYIKISLSPQKKT